MRESELETVLGWAAEEGWNPGLDDAPAYWSADPGGFFVAEEDGAPVAAISVVNHSDDFAFLGLYICCPSHRGRGTGFALWRYALEHAGDRVIGLDGVQDQQENYARSGFVAAGETVRYAGAISAAENPGIRAARKDDIAALVDLEAAASGWLKPAYLTGWFTDSANRQTLLSERNGAVDGFATVRRCHQGAKIGPLWSDSPTTARTLLAQAAMETGPELVIDVPTTSPRLDAICRDLGLSPGFTTARMYRGQPRPQASDLFAVATLELG